MVFMIQMKKRSEFSFFREEVSCIDPAVDTYIPHFLLIVWKACRLKVGGKRNYLLLDFLLS